MNIFTVRTNRVSGITSRTWDLSVTDPTTGEGHIYHGSALDAHKVLNPGIYDGTYEIDTFGTIVDVRLIVGHTYSYMADTDMMPISIQFNAKYGTV